MVHFVLDADGQQPFRVHFEWLAVAADRANANTRGTGELVVNAGQGQASLLSGALAFLAEDFRVDEHQGLIACRAEGEHYPAWIPAHWGGGEPNPLGGVRGGG